MSDSPATTSRPVALIVTLSIFFVVSIGWFVVSHYYSPSAAAPQNQTAENMQVEDAKTKQPTDIAWRATPGTRQKALTDLRTKQATQASSYAWVDQKAGVVQLPIERAMQLTAEQYGSKK